jgi:hypothetical protein
MFEKLFRRIANIVKSPLEIACQRDDIRAAARYWRQRIARARIGSPYDASYETTVRSAFTQDELDRFEREMALQFAQVLVYVPHRSELLKEHGTDVSLYVSCAARQADLESKLAYPGFMTRMRILPGCQVAYENAPYQSGDWVTVWTPHSPPDDWDTVGTTERHSPPDAW